MPDRPATPPPPRVLTRRRRAIAVTLCTGAAALAVPGLAHAATEVGYSPTAGLTIVGDEGGGVLNLSTGGDDQRYLVSIVATTGPVEINNQGGCATVDTVHVDCPITGVRKIGATLGAGDDGVGLNASTSAPPRNFGPMTVDFGEGNDNIDGRGTSAPIIAEAGAGNDGLRGGRGNDVFHGGDGNDTLIGHAGVDTMEGGAGDDTFEAFADVSLDGTPSGALGQVAETTPTPDVMDGGPGVDAVDYRFTDEHVNVSLDGVANDGRVGEGDNALNIENVTGGRRSNTLIGNDEPNRLGVSICCPALGGDDVMRGGGGDDVIGAGRGNDQVFGDGGKDLVWGGGGSDTIDGGDGDDDLRDEGQSGVVVSGGPNRGNDLSQQLGAGGLVEPGDDTIFGGDGNDTITTREGTDVSHGGAGDDLMRVFGPPANPNEETPVAGLESAFGDAGKDDIVASGSALLKVDGGSGDDTLQTAANSVILGGSGDDVIRNVSGSGKDTIDAGSGDDTVESGNGNDTVDGGSGDDLLGNAAGTDAIKGGLGDDVINTRQTAAVADTVDCGTGPRTDHTPDNDLVTMNLIDTQLNCENVTTTPGGELANVSVPRTPVVVPARGRVAVTLKCLPRAGAGGCTGTIRLGTISPLGRAGASHGPALRFRLLRNRTRTLLVPVSGTDRARLRRRGSGARLQLVIVQPGKLGPHTTVRAVSVRRA